MQRLLKIILMEFNNYSVFLSFYFCYLEKVLLLKKDQISSIKFQSEEANSDEWIKKFLKEIISNHPSVPCDNSFNFTSLNISIDNETSLYSYNDIKGYHIEEVKLPEELTDEEKKGITSTKSSVYTNPDLFIKISDEKNNFAFFPVEIKTTKDNNIPGSSVQQVSPYEWTIFIKHNDNEVDVSCGWYINAITDKLPFPDRSPRPQVGFNTMKKWNTKNRKENNGTLIYNLTQKEITQKTTILQNWEDILTKEWRETIGSTKKSNDKWFNNTIRKFSLNLLEEIKKTPDKLNDLIKLLKDNIN